MSSDVRNVSYWDMLGLSDMWIRLISRLRSDKTLILCQPLHTVKLDAPITAKDSARVLDCFLAFI